MTLTTLKIDLVKNWPQLQSFELEHVLREFDKSTWNFHTLFLGVLKGY